MRIAGIVYKANTKGLRKLWGFVAVGATQDQKVSGAIPKSDVQVAAVLPLPSNGGDDMTGVLKLWRYCPFVSFVVLSFSSSFSFPHPVIFVAPSPRPTSARWFTWTRCASISNRMLVPTAAVSAK